MSCEVRFGVGLSLLIWLAWDILVDTRVMNLHPHRSWHVWVRTQVRPLARPQPSPATALLMLMHAAAAAALPCGRAPSP